MATRSIISKNIAESSSTYTGVDGELILDTVTNTLKISDGTTAGGIGITIPKSVSQPDGSTAAIDITKGVVILDGNTSGDTMTYTLADGTYVGQMIHLCIGTSTGLDTMKIAVNSYRQANGTYSSQTIDPFFGSSPRHHNQVIIWNGNGWAFGNGSW